MAVRLAWLVQVHETYGTRTVEAHVVLPQENGELHSPQWGWSEGGRDFHAFRVTAYLGHPNYTTSGSTGSEIWGLGHDFQPFRVENGDQARAIVRVFGRVERGLKRAEEESGYVKDGDFHAYLLRIGAALGIREYHVRNYGRQREMTGERFRKVTPSTLQWWLGDIVQLADTEPQALKV